MADKHASLRTRHSGALDESDKYKLLVDSVEDYAIFLLDCDGYIQTWNKGAQKTKGWTADEIVGRHFSTFYQEHDKQARKPERELEIAKRFGRVEDEDWRVRKDGTKFWANVVITALRDDTGTLVGFAKVTRNLTERKEHEDDLRRANAVLRQHQKELEALNTSKDEFVSLASHQLRTPATAIKQLLSMLLDGFNGPLSARHKQVIQKAYFSNERQLAIVNSLLKVAQIDAGKVVLKKSPTNLYRLLGYILEDHADSFGGRAQNYSLHIDDGLKREALLDETNIRMALDNIVDNASKYTPKGGSVKLRADKQNDKIHIAIQDTGVGIAAEDMPKLFERFSRISNYLPNAVPGSGLGLYWAEKIIALHGGKIEVDSEINEGTTFHIFLPWEPAR